MMSHDSRAYGGYLKLITMAGNEVKLSENYHKKYVKLSYMFKRIIDSEYPICIQDINNYSYIWDMCFDI